MNQEILISMISLICKFKDPSISKEQKEFCMEKIVNCAIIKDGQSSIELLKECEKKWQK